ncbi:hypothetical protein [Pseudonocardia spirodelae]|uniref:DUF4386 domain-containing protein n=1 Tax=Pseudonocardia spirodelae TaxID=3133431 RepID=A0ABU8T665_9PSEU
MSQRIQSAVVWFALATTAIYGACLIFLLKMVPPPSATWTAEQVAAFYQENSVPIRVGAVIAGWTSAFIMPLGIVCAVQMRRVERGRILSILTACGGTIMSIFLVLPPVMWGTAAFSPERAPEITAMLHELALLTLVTTDQYFLFMWVPIAIVCFVGRPVPHSPFPRWFGYLTAWIAVMFEAGAIAFLPKSGVFAWNGLFVFWSPLLLFGVWIICAATLLLRNIKRQRLDAEAAEDAGRPYDDHDHDTDRQADREVGADDARTVSAG